MKNSRIPTNQRIKFVLAVLRQQKYREVAKRYNTNTRTILNCKSEFIEAARIHLANDYLKSDNFFIKKFREQFVKDYVKKNRKLEEQNNKLRESIKLIGKIPKKTRRPMSEKLIILERIKETSMILAKALRIVGINLETYKKWKKLKEEGKLEVPPHKFNKYKDAFYINNVFKLLHEPPLKYGIYRTNWKFKDVPKVLKSKGIQISHNTVRKIIKGAGFIYRHAREVLTSNDPDYDLKVNNIKRILSNIKHDELFFSFDEYGPLRIKMQGGRSLNPIGARKTYLAHEQFKGIIIMIAAVELKTNQVTHFFSKTKSTKEIIKLINVLRAKYFGMKKLFISGDGLKVHSSKKLLEYISEINDSKVYPKIELAPLPNRAPFLNVIESVFSGMCKAIIHNSNYKTKQECIKAINRYFRDRNKNFTKHPKRAGNKIWGFESTPIKFNESNNCKPYNVRGISKPFVRNHTIA